MLAEDQSVLAYRIRRHLGGGAMGDVYAALSPSGEEVALKVLRLAHGAGDAALIARFNREARVCASLTSPNLVPVLDHGVFEGVPFIVMPLLRGRDLESWLERTGALEPPVATALALHMCEGLRVAHATGVIHRDLKPANVFLAEGESSQVTAVVCDFGIAKVLDAGGALTASGAALGTPLFMAPEQFLDAKRVDERSDVWAVGMTLYAMLTGASPFERTTSLPELVAALQKNAIPHIQSAAPWVGPGLARVVHAALLPRERRLPSVDALRDALRAWSRPAAFVHVRDLVAIGAETRGGAAASTDLPHHHAELGTPDDGTIESSARAGAPQRDPLVGRTLGGSYLVERKIGGGGMGAVYEAVHASQGHVAIKMMHLRSEAAATESVRRFLREARAAHAVESRHVVRLIDSSVDTETNMPFLVMELLRGRDLASVIRAQGALEAPAAVALFLQACEGLSAAHALGIVHRDVKPSNLFLHEGEDGLVTLKVCDFGIAKQIVPEADRSESTELTMTGGLLGSPVYMSPEQAKNAKRVDARTDVYSLSLSLHEALSGRHPWAECSSVGEIIVAVCTQDLPRLEVIAPWCDRKLAEIVHRGLARDPADRFESVTSLSEALRPFAVERPLRAVDLVAVSSAALASAGASAQSQDGTERGVAGPHRPTGGKRRRLVVAAIALAVSATFGIALFRALGSTDKVATSEPARQESADPSSLAILPSATIVPSDQSSAPAPEPHVTASVSAVKPKPVSAASARPSSAASAEAPKIAPSASGARAPVGRGGTAMDVPF